MPMDSIQILKDNYQNLTRKQKAIADYLLANPEAVCYITLKELSQRTSATEVTILRMCKKLGFESYIEMKKSFRDHTQRLIKGLSEPNYILPDESLTAPEEKIRLMRQICLNEYNRSTEFYQSVDLDSVFRAARLILKAKYVMIVGQGISKIVADFFYSRISPLGINSALIDPMDMDNVQASLAKLKEDDLVIAISFPRYCTPVHNIVQYAEYRGAAVISITDSLEDSPAVTKNSLNFLCETSTKVFYNSLSLPFALVNLIASGIVLEMGSEYSRLVAESKKIISFVNEEGDS